VVEGRRERKVVTVLFADLVGFTSRAETLDPEDVADELGRYHGHVRDELERYGGTVEKVIGDAVMALFGAPTAHEDDPERAVRAAFAIRDWAVEEDVEVRIGINTGEALVSVDARPEAGEAMAAGDVINTGARLQAAAPVNGVVVGVQTYRATERAIEYQDADPVEAKGKSQPIAVWHALRARSRVAVDRVHGATLVGRLREVALLNDALARVIEEASPQLVTLVGVPGIGKSRLVLELFGTVDQRPELVSWRQGRCLPYGDGVTFWALGEMVKAQVGILEADSGAEAEQKLREAVDDGWVLSHLRPLVGLGGSEAAGDARGEAFAAWSQFFEELAQRSPLVLVFEDIHWADDHLLEFIDELVERAGDTRLLVVCTARPELLTRRAGWGGGMANALTISLPPLSDDDTARLIGELTGTLLQAETQAELLERAGGNPLYAEEFTRMIRDRGTVGPLPETVQGLIAARLDLLEPDDKGLLQDAAVVGKRFWTGALAALGDGDPAVLDRVLRTLERKEFIRRERSGDEGEYAFRHLLVRDVAYGQIPRADRAAKHLGTARWIESLGRVEDHAEMLAHHYLEALDLTRAAGGDTGAFADAACGALAGAGERAMALNAYDAAARFFREALDLVPDGDARRGRLVPRLGRALFLLGEPDLTMLAQARDDLVAAGQIESATEVEIAISEGFWMLGEGDRAMASAERARLLADDLELSPTKVRVPLLLSRLAMLNGRNREAIDHGEEALAMGETLGLGDVRAAALVNIASARASLDEGDWLGELATAVEAARKANARFDEVRALGNGGSRLFRSGRIAESLRMYEEAEARARQYGQRGFQRWLQVVYVAGIYESGRWDDARRRVADFIADLEAGSPHYLGFEAHLWRALLRMTSDDRTGALEDAESALEYADRAGDPQAQYPTQSGVSFILAELGLADRAAEVVAGPLAAAESRSEEVFKEAGAHVLAWTLTVLGRNDEAVAVLERAPETPWIEAGIAFARGEPAAAAEILTEIGALASAAYCRLSAARRGDLAQLEPALAFYRSVGATWFVEEGESLLAASA
jgi:class 3 adenylate cyclase/tetratricopeptide (TPR) repeat protein